MKLRLSILLLAAALAASPAAGQTIKSLGYNTTNGNIVAATNVTFTNSVGFATNAQAATRTNLGGTTVGDSVFTATNAAAAATAVGLGTANSVTFQSLTAELLQVRLGTNLYVGLADDVSEFWTDVAVNGTTTLNGVNNTMPNATNAASGSSLMTRDLSDGRYSGFTGLQILPMEYSRCSPFLTNGGSISIARGNVRLTSGVTNGSGAGLTFSDGRIFLTTQGQHTAYQGYGIYALNGQLGANNDTVYGIFYGSAPANGVPSFEPLSTNGYSVQLRNNGTNQLRYLYKNGTNEVSGPWTSLPSAFSSSVQFAGINTTNGFRVLYRRPDGLATTGWTVLTNVAVSWTWASSNSAGAGFSAVSFIRTNTTSTNSLLNDAGEFGFIIGGENL